MSTMHEIRAIERRDELRWRELWDGYTRFYEREPSEPTTIRTWTLIMDPDSPVFAVVAVDQRDHVIGIANYLIHETTSALSPVCYLQDLFVDPAIRGGGVGKALIDWLIEDVRRRGLSRLYWSTRETNYRARGLYDKYALQSGFLKYIVPNPDM
jgi:GNAT superfamily N-acetyltransferase